MTLRDIWEQYRDEADFAELEYRSLDRDNTPISTQAYFLERWLERLDSFREFCKDNNLSPT